MNEKDIYTNFGLLLKSRREKLGYSQQEIADRLGVTKSSYGLYERGGRKVPLSMIIELSAILRFDLDDFFKTQRETTPVEDLRLKWDDEFDGIEWTEEEGEQIREFARFILSKRGDRK